MTYPFGVDMSRSGVYQITNIVNGKRYIGSSQNIWRRWNAHIFHLRNNKHHNSHLQSAWNKYGEEQFRFNVLMYCDEDNVRMFEQLALDGLKPEYNIAPEVTTQGCRLAEETKEKLSEVLMGHIYPEERNKKISEALKGRILSDEHKEKISLSHLGHKPSEETREKLSLSHLGRPHPICAFSEEHKEKISKALSGRVLPEEQKEKMSKAMTGHIFSEEHNEKIRLSHLGLKPSEETKAKISESKKLYFAKKRGEL